MTAPLQPFDMVAATSVASPSISPLAICPRTGPHTAQCMCSSTINFLHRLA
uniref:Uncharacterized protein n=1 Tax=Arundo donax TaxID=35708 RepID=A0A0A9DLX5_ARUDO